MDINEIASDILKREDDQLARAFTMTVAALLIDKGIQPIIEKTIEEWNQNDDLSKYIIRKEYKVTFDLDTSEHDAKVIDEFMKRCVDNQAKLFINPSVSEQAQFKVFLKYIAEQIKSK